MLTSRKQMKPAQRCCDLPFWTTETGALAALDRKKRISYADSPSGIYRCRNGNYHLTSRSEPTQGGLTDWERVKAGVFRRDHGRCIVCGTGRDLHAHHRRLQSQGGQDVPQNLVTLCGKDHDRVHNHPIESAKAGLIVRKGADPRNVPVEHREWDEPIYLTSDYQYGLGGAA